MNFEEKNGLKYPYATPPEFGEVLEIIEGVFWTRMPLPMSLQWINIWLLKDGDNWVLVDTGMKYPQGVEVWEKLIENLLGTSKIERIIATHMHPDHIGMAGWIADKFDAKLLMSRLEYVTCRLLVADTGREAPEEGVEFYRRAGWGTEQLDKYKKRFGGFGRVVHQMPDSFYRLTDGDLIKIGNYEWRAIGTNGHSPEHICLYCEAEKLLISGDQVLPKISPNVSVFPTEPEANPLLDFLASCGKLQMQIHDDALVLPSHIAPFYGVQTRLSALIAHHESALERLHEFCKTGAKTAIECCSVLFKKPVTSDDIGMATGEALAHINYLLAEGKLVRSFDGEVYRYLSN